jgi:hypothetical protein
MRRENADPAPGMKTSGLFAAGLASVFAGLAAAALAQAPVSAPATPPENPQPRPIVTPVQIANLPLGVVTFPGGKAINLTVGVGSSAFRMAGDAQGRIWLLTDRGPAIDCADTRRLIGLDPEQACAGSREGRILPLPGFVPSIYGVDIGADNVARINVFSPFKGRTGRPVSGRPNPSSGGALGEPSFGTDGKPLPPDPSGLDPEGFVRLADGSFWIAEEYGPSIAEIAVDGAIKRRLVPANAAADFKDADYEIVPILPPIMRQRLPGRGFEGLAISPDERFLYVAMQSPLANPDAETGRQSTNIRIWKIERENGLVAGQYLYTLDQPGAFRAYSEVRKRDQSHVSVGEIVALGEDRLLVVERIEKTARFFTVTLEDANRIPAAFDAPEARPTLEQISGEGLAQSGLMPARKTLVLDSDTVQGLPAKIEAVAVTGPDELIVVNDNDFAIDGVRTQMFRVTLPTPLLR